MISSVTIIPVFAIIAYLEASPVILKESSPSGEAVVAISSSDPDIEKYLTFNFPATSKTNQGSDPVISINPDEFFKSSFSLAAPGQASAGTGRNFVSTSNFNPFLLPIFNLPLNLEGFGMNNFGSSSNRFKGVENYYEPTFASNGNGEVKAVTVINDNGHMYGKVKTVTFDNRAKNTK